MQNDWTTTIDSMRSCLEQREKLISKLISELVEKDQEIERLNRFINRIEHLKGEGQ